MSGLLFIKPDSSGKFSFPEGTKFFDSNGVPVVYDGGIPVALDSENPRTFGKDTLASDGVEMSESDWRAKFDL